MDNQNTNTVEQTSDPVINPADQTTTETNVTDQTVAPVASPEEQAATETNTSVSVPEPPTTKDTPISLQLVAIFVCGVVLAIIFRLLKRKKNLPIVTFDEACQYAKKLKETNSNMVSSLISVVVNDKTQQKNFIQVALDANNKPIMRDAENFVGRQFEISDVDDKLKGLLGDDCKVILPLE